MEVFLIRLDLFWVMGGIDVEDFLIFGTSWAFIIYLLKFMCLESGTLYDPD
jgi:hypothetical protein